MVEQWNSSLLLLIGLVLVMKLWEPEIKKIMSIDSDQSQKQFLKHLQESKKDSLSKQHQQQHPIASTFHATKVKWNSKRRFTALACNSFTINNLLAILVEVPFFLVIKVPCLWSLAAFYWIRFKLLRRRFNGQISSSIYNYCEGNLIKRYMEKSYAVMKKRFGVQSEGAVIVSDLPFLEKILTGPLSEEILHRFLLDKLWRGLSRGIRSCSFAFHWLPRCGLPQASGPLIMASTGARTTNQIAWVVFNSILFGLSHIGNYFPLREARRLAYEVEWKKYHEYLYGSPPRDFDYEKEIQKRALHHFVSSTLYALFILNPMYLSHGLLGAFGSHAVLNAAASMLMESSTGAKRR